MPTYGDSKKCSICGEEKPIDDFRFQTKKAVYRHSYCKPCQSEKTKAYRNANLEWWKEWSRNHSRERRSKDLKSIQRHELTRRCKKFGVTVAWHEAQMAKQNGVCALCLKPEVNCHVAGGTVRSLAIDHHHGNGKARGLLCSSCNQAVGKIEASPGWLERAAEYLKEQ